MGPKYMIAGMGDAGPCHPRDNIALRWLADKLELGYDLFDAIMHAREKQAKLMAEVLVKEAKKMSLPIYIHGKAYKPNVHYVDGSYSLLVGWYCKELGIDPIYIDPLTEFNIPDSVKGIVLLAHNQKITYGYSGVTDEQPLYCKIEKGSIVVDPWRTYKAGSGVKVIHYGNTRGQLL
jgi:UDPglucose 6-dehydrogenase